MAMSLRPEEFYREPSLGKPRRLAEQFVNTIRRRQQGLTLAHLPRRMPISPSHIIKGWLMTIRREGYRKSGAQTVCPPVDKISGYWHWPKGITDLSNGWFLPPSIVSFTRGNWILKLDGRACPTFTFNDLTFSCLHLFCDINRNLWRNTNLILILGKKGSDHFWMIRGVICVSLTFEKNNKYTFWKSI